ASVMERFARIRWLLFIRDTKLNQYFDGMNIPHDSEFIVARKSQFREMIELYEVYRIFPSWPIIQDYIGTWLPHNQINWSTASFLDRRRNLERIELRGTASSF
ncbi:hypothetical protein L9F63_002709, partial [Diploptera punctata]